MSVVPFRRSHANGLTNGLSREELVLLRLFQGRVQFMWRGGWALEGETGGVEVLRKQNCICIWLSRSGHLVFIPIETGVATLFVVDAESAYHTTLALLGGQDDDPASRS